MLLTDTNILLRCSLGRAMERVVELSERGVRLATTDRNAAEMLSVLVGKLGLDEDYAAAETVRVLEPFEMIFRQEYEYLQPVALDRLRTGGKSDWPTLAAAIALDAEIWTEDTDFFGVGVPVWSTDNIHHVKAAA